MKRKYSHSAAVAAMGGSRKAAIGLLVLIGGLLVSLAAHAQGEPAGFVLALPEVRHALGQPIGRATPSEPSRGRHHAQ
jgi:hypothetical protein